MSYGRHPYGGVGYAGADAADIPGGDTATHLSVEVAFTTGALETPAWEDITPDVRFWDTYRGRSRELERFQPGRATVVLGNRERQYDSVTNANIRPMRRIRIRETFNGVTYPVFDGYIDRWQLDYPGTGHDATATTTATDAFKIFARTDLGRSVYHELVVADAPAIYWPLDETLATAIEPLVAINHGTTGETNNGTYVGPPLRVGEQGLIVKDPGQAIMLNQDTLGESVFLEMGVDAPGTFDLWGNAPFALEAWCIPIEDPPGTALDDAALWADDNGAHLGILYDVSAGAFTFGVLNDAAGGFTATSAVAQRGKRHHVVGRFVSGEVLQLWVDGVLTTSAATTGAFTNGVGSDIHFGSIGTTPGNNNWVGWIAHGAIYLGAAATAVDQTWVDAHYEAGANPWQGDEPDDRLGRVLDLADWPADLRDLDPGDAALQSADITGQTVLEHMQKVGETEFGLLFMTRDGKVRLVDRDSQALRTPGPAVYGDNPGEVGYRAFVPDDGDAVIRNRVTISRLNGVARTDEDQTSIDEFGRFQYTLDGLLHQSDVYSFNYAQFLVAQYKDPRRRVTSLTVGPPIAGEEATVYPAMLGPELGDVISVTNTPIGGGDPFEQVCVIEGIANSGTPGGIRQVTFTLSPEFTF